jgi:hypothetical protein
MRKQQSKQMRWLAVVWASFLLLIFVSLSALRRRAGHVTPPGESVNVIIASNIGRIGKKADEDDTRVIETGKANLERNKKGDHFEVELPLEDKAKKTIGAVGIVFMYKPNNEKAFQKEAEQIRDEMAARTPTIEKLFEK